MERRSNLATPGLAEGKTTVREGRGSAVTDTSSRGILDAGGQTGRSDLRLQSSLAAKLTSAWSDPKHHDPALRTLLPRRAGQGPFVPHGGDPRQSLNPLLVLAPEPLAKTVGE